MNAKCAETPTRAKSLTPFSLTLRGKAEEVGRAGAAQGAPHAHTRPQVPSHGLLRRRHVPAGAASGAVRGVRDFRPHDDPALGLQRLGRSDDRKAARSCCRFADRAEVSGRGGRGSELVGFPAATLSPAGPALAGAAATRARTGPSCSPAAGSSAPDPRGLAGPGLRPRASLLPENES